MIFYDIYFVLTDISPNATENIYDGKDNIQLLLRFENINDWNFATINCEERQRTLPTWIVGSWINVGGP